MPRTRSRALGAATCLWLGVILLDAQAQAKDVPPGWADEAVRAAWGTQIRKEHVCDVHHVGYRLRPAPFKSTVPCGYAEAITYADGMLPWDGAAPIAELLASVVGEPDSSSELPACPDSLTADHITLGFAQGRKSLTLAIAPTAGTIQVRDGKDRVWYIDLDHRTGELLTLLARSIPGDTRLTAIVPCPGRISAAGDTANASAASDYYRVEELPEVLHKVQPEYPREGLKKNEEGVVEIQALVDTLGHVARTRIAHSIGTCDESAVRAVEQWRFRPATSNHRPVPVWVTIPVTFRLTE